MHELGNAFHHLLAAEPGGALLHQLGHALAIALGLTFDKAQTVTLAVAAYRGYASIDWGALSAAAITSMLPMLIFAVLAQRQIVGGLSLGAVK